MPTQAEARAQFPALESGFAFFENAGGSQVPHQVIDAISRYMRESYVQLGARYPQSDVATQAVEEAHRWMNLYMNGEALGMTVLGPSTSQLLSMLADGYSRVWQPGDEVIICQTAHEANAGPWAKLDRFGIKTRSWRVDPQTFQCDLDQLEKLFTPQTKLLAFPHVSNLLGEIVDVKGICALARSKNVKTVVDGVAYAPHHAIDVKEWNCDFYAFSTYKTFGPHMGALFGRFDAWEEVPPANHFFLPDNNAYAYELGGASHEGCAGLLGLRDYFGFIAGVETVDRTALEQAWMTMAGWEKATVERIFGHLTGDPRFRIIGPSTPEGRVGTISLVAPRWVSSKLAKRVNGERIGIRSGNMYAYRLCKALGIDPDEGVVRISTSHYNTVEEADYLWERLNAALG